MRLILVMTIIGALFSGPALAENVRVATLNTYWLFDDDAPHASWGERRDPQSYSDAITIVADAIISLNANIVALQVT